MINDPHLLPGRLNVLLLLPRLVHKLLQSQGFEGKTPEQAQTITVHFLVNSCACAFVDNYIKMQKTGMIIIVIHEL